MSFDLFVCFLEEEEEEWMMVYIEWGRIYMFVTYVEHMRYDGEMSKYLCEQEHRFR